MRVMHLIYAIFWVTSLFLSAKGGICAAPLSPEKVCQFYTAQIEQIYKIPDKLLTAVSLTESGRSTKNGPVAWPWTINVGGEGFYFPTKHAAIQAVRRFQSKGIKSIDVGCMQVNLLHHPNAFKNLEEAFDPKANIAYAAKFLTDLKASHKNWQTAVAHYHSATPAYHIPYKKKVLKTWLAEKKKNRDLPPMALASSQKYTRWATRPIMAAHRFRSPPAPLTVQRVRAFTKKIPTSSSRTRVSYRAQIPPFLGPVKRVTSLRRAGLSAR